MPPSLHPRDLPRALERAAPGVRVLSLDCFDTLLWRATHAPADVFAELNAVGVTAHARMFAEHAARARAKRLGRSEVTLTEIVEALAPFADEAGRQALIAAELGAEARRCFAFGPTVELIRAAKAQGLQVVIVSDTYLSPDQLGALIRQVVGDETFASIDRIFASSAYGRPKAAGLFEDVLAELAVPPAAVLHMGDNAGADLHPPLRLGMQALHLRQFDAETESRLRMEASATALLRGAGRLHHGAVQPHRAALAVGHTGGGSAAGALGYGVVGPVLDAFADWIAAEREALQARTTGRVKLAFLMRDGFLPQRAFEARFGADPDVCALHLSRFTAIAAAFRTPADVLRHCADKLADTDPELLGPQLHLKPAEVAELAGAGASAVRRARFSAALGKPALLGRIVARSARLRERLMEHVRAQTGAAPGDRLVLVDLGYNGTVQNWAEPLLREELGVEVSGRYLLLRPQEMTGFDKAGLIDASLVDDDALGALARYIAVLEQLCTAAEGSVCDYRDGRPVLRANDIKAGQSAVRDAVQAAALAYVADRPSHPRPAVTVEEERMAAASVLARLLFFPSPAELEALSDFQHDVNLGTSKTHPLFEPELGAEQLRERGVFFVNGAQRMYLPAEIGGEALPLGLTLMASARFGLELRHADFHPAPVRLPVMVADGVGGVHLDELPAYRTHDGYLRCVIPVADRRFSVGLQFGRLYEWVQLDSLRFEPADQATDFEAGGRPVHLPAEAVGQDVASPAPGLLHMETEAAFILAAPPPRTDDSQWVLTAVFRPLTERAAAAATAAARLAA